MKRNFAHISEEQQKARHRVIDAAWHKRSRGSVDEATYRALVTSVDTKFETPAQPTAEDLVKIGAVFDRLTIIGFTENKFGQTEALCRCACGTNEHRANIAKLASKHTKSCGCLRKAHGHATEKDRAFSQMYGTYKAVAKQKGLVFALTKGEFEELILSPCYYCGIAPYRIWFAKNGSLPGQITCNGIDRVNNSEGYTASNSVPACPRCNYAKRNMPVSEFVTWAVYLADNLRRTNLVDSLTTETT